MSRRVLREYLSFSRREQNGILVLVSIIVILILVRLAINIIKPGNDTSPEEIDQFIADLEKLESPGMESRTALYEGGDSNQNREEDSMFSFDPNVTSREDLLKLGLTERVINTIFNYLESGGRFYKKEDLRKIYGLSGDTYLKLEPYIQIDSQTEENDHFPASRKPGESGLEPIEINSADTMDLMPLKGIGPVLSRRILKYRNLLGGFYWKEQLLEVYGLTSVTYSEIEAFIEIDTFLVKKINLNQCTYADLIRHPY
ncbi:MAG: helix-hairpin-helix domain-containing protein, partial [Bacteroidales bacterium]